MAASDRISASTGSSEAHAARHEAGGRGRRPALVIVATRRPWAMFLATAPAARTAASAADWPREHPPPQAIGALDRRRDVHSKRAEVAAVRIIGRPAPAALHPPPISS